ncbi:MAG: glycosyltransferase family 2 protein [Pseudomonadota bacterium]
MTALILPKTQRVAPAYPRQTPHAKVVARPPANRDASLPQPIAPAQKRWQHIWLAPVAKPVPPAPNRGPTPAPEQIDLVIAPPDLRLIDQLGPGICLRHGLIPWRRVGGATVIATAHPDRFADRLPDLTETFGPVIMARATQTAIEASILHLRGRALTEAAEAAPPAKASCRSLATKPIAIATGAAAFLGLAALALAPVTAAAALLVWALVALTAMTALRLIAIASELCARPGLARHFASTRSAAPDGDLPHISVLVPLLRETDITRALTDRLGALDYPRERLDILFVLEQSDSGTHAALRARHLGPGMRTVTVPPGTIRTKPRALNFALDFAQGEIIGIYDAEDAPDPGQLRTVAAAFAHVPAKVACLQGKLDFYNAKATWLTRCFTIDYATWFRVFLPGLARLGFAIPLGGTTLFLRRTALEQIGRWDAHNVTEDADLGIRLARHGYETRIIDTTTAEEATARVRPWIRQRSRWLKGYALTYAVHMRNPAQLYRDLGLRRFLGFQVLFLGTLTLFLCAPLFWTFWVLPFALPHPLFGQIATALLIPMIALFLVSEAVSLTGQLLAISAPRHRRLWAWLPAMQVYYPLAVIAAYKGIGQIILRPYFWEKTDHGQT